MTQHETTGGVSYPTPVAETLADLADYLGDDWAVFASDLAREADGDRGLYGEEARDWLHAEITGTHAKPDDWGKPAPPAGFMYDLTVGLDLDDRQRMRLAMVFSYGSEELPKPRKTPARDAEAPPAGMFRRYPGEGETDAGCSVSHPDAGGQCPRAVVGEVWNMPFCGPHGREAELAAHEEIAGTAGRELRGHADALAQRWPADEHLTRAVESARVPVPDFDPGEHERITREAYPPEACRIDPETAAYDYGREYAGDGPVDWWNDARELVVRHVREADSLGLGALRGGLELLRQQATTQQMLAEDDFERRYAVPKRAEIAARKEAEAARDPHAETLHKINGRLTQAADLLETVPPETFVGREGWLIRERVSEAGFMVSSEETRRKESEGPA